MNNQVFFRLPNQSQVLQIQQDSSGLDSFVIRGFNPKLDIDRIQGKIKPVGVSEVKSCVSTWKPGQVQQVNLVDYRKLVDLCIEKIQEGEFEKLVPARQKLIESMIQPAELFEQLLSHYEKAFVYMFHFNGIIMIGASPETLMVREGDTLKTEALGGTLTHGVYSDKESIEHLHIVRYITSKLKELEYEFIQMPTIPRKAGPVEHLSTGFQLKSKGLSEDLALTESLHPTPAVCGLPYQKALDFLQQSEGMDRAYYSGYLGPVYANGNFELFVNLRCAEIYDGHYKLFAGAGVNALSQAEDEFQETENKMQTIAQWLK